MKHCTLCHLDIYSTDITECLSLGQALIILHYASQCPCSQRAYILIPLQNTVFTYLNTICSTVSFEI